MLFVSVEDFYQKAGSYTMLSREDEKLFAEKMNAGDLEARCRIIQSYLPMVASHIKHLARDLQSLELVYRCIHSLEKATDSFNFLQDSEKFSHRLSWWLRQTVARYIAEKHR